MKKYKILLDDDYKYRLCRRIGIYYFEESIGSLHPIINLFTLYIAIKTKRPIFHRNVDLPGSIYKKYQNRYLYDDTKQELKKMGIYSYYDIEKIVTSLLDNSDQDEIDNYMSANKEKIDESIQIHDILLKMLALREQYKEEAKKLIKG